jgi:FKBP-type peptidyl-prolyl cis-trans isomerase SlpA
MTQPQLNDTVILICIGRLDNGSIFMETTRNEPFTITIGNNELPPSVEAALCTMHTGETRKIRVPPEEGYGGRQKDLVQVIDNQQLVDRIHPKPGMIMSLKVVREGEEHAVPATVMSVEGSKITVDYNHPLAGHHLNYELTIVKIISSAE